MGRRDEAPHAWPRRARAQGVHRQAKQGQRAPTVAATLSPGHPVLGRQYTHGRADAGLGETPQRGHPNAPCLQHVDERRVMSGETRIRIVNGHRVSLAQPPRTPRRTELEGLLRTAFPTANSGKPGRARAPEQWPAPMSPAAVALQERAGATRCDARDRCSVHTVRARTGGAQTAQSVRPDTLSGPVHPRPR